MRKYLFALALAGLAAPVAAAPAPEEIRIPPELTDPRTIEKLERMNQALAKALLDMPVGELKAAAEGRPATEHDKGVTLRDLGRLKDPNFEANLQRQIAESGPRLREAMKAFSAALPAMTKALSQAADTMERAMENMPRPDYPKR